MSMMTFEVNILCENNSNEKDNRCMGIVTGPPHDRIEKAIEAAEDEARSQDWVWLKTWYCTDCAAKLTQ